MHTLYDEDAYEMDQRLGDDPPRKEYPRREIYAYGRYIECQILNWKDGPPPKYLVCQPLDGHYRQEFLAGQGMGTWMRIELRDVVRELP